MVLHTTYLPYTFKPKHSVLKSFFFSLFFLSDQFFSKPFFSKLSDSLYDQRWLLMSNFRCRLWIVFLSYRDVSTKVNGLTFKSSTVLRRQHVWSSNPRHSVSLTQAWFKSDTQVGRNRIHITWKYHILSKGKATILCRVGRVWKRYLFWGKTRIRVK